MYILHFCSVLAMELNTNRVEYERRARELVEKFAKGADRTVLRKVRNFSILAGINVFMQTCISICSYF